MLFSVLSRLCTFPGFTYVSFLFFFLARRASVARDLGDPCGRCRDFKFRILDRRIQEIVNRDLFRYQYRQNLQHWNYNFYSIPHVNNRSNFNRPNINVKPNVNVRPNIPVNPYTKPINTNPSNGNTTIISKPSTNKLNNK